MLAPFFKVFWKAAMAQNYKKTYRFFWFLAISHLLDAHHFFIDFGCQHEAQNTSKIQVLKLMLGSLAPSLMTFGDMWGNLAL